MGKAHQYFIKKRFIAKTINSDLSVFYLYLFNYLGRNATNNRIRFYILRHHSTCCHYCSIANSHACKNGGIGSYPDVFTNVYRCIAHALTTGRVEVVVDGSEHDVVTDERAFVDGDAALILELAAHIDEDMFANDGVLAAIGVEGWEHAYRLGHFTTPKLLQ